MKRAIFIATIFATAVFAACTAGNFDFRIIDNTPGADGTAVEITWYTGRSRRVRIPPTIQNLPVTRIGAEAFYHSRLTDVIIPDGVTHIGYGAFMGNRLTSVNIPGSVEHIGNGAFMGNRLTSVVIPGSVTVIPRWAFSHNLLTDVCIPGNVATIGIGAFWDNRLTNVSVPSHAEIHPDAFDPGVTVTRR